MNKHSTNNALWLIAMLFHVKHSFPIKIYTQKLIAWFGVTNFPTFSENPKIYYRVKTNLGPVLIYPYMNTMHTHANLVEYMV
jgi:hypothetical protein